MDVIFFSSDSKQVSEEEYFQSIGLEDYEGLRQDIQEKMNDEHHVEKLYLIQLFDYNLPGFVSGVTKVFVEDIEQFSTRYQGIETDKARVERFLRSKSGEIVTDYYSDDPSLNIVQQVDVQELGYRMIWRRDQIISVENGFGCESDYWFKVLAMEIRWIKDKDTYYKLVKPSGRDCCIQDFSDVTRRWGRVTVMGNPFWIHKEKSKLPYASDSLDDYQGISLEAYVWQVADTFETEEEVKADMKMGWLSKEQISRAFADIPGDAG